MSAELLKRAEKIRSDFKFLEGRPGTGHHDNDRNAANPALFAAPQKNGLPRASEHVVAFFDHDDDEIVHFVGPDAERVMTALAAWKKKCDGSNPNLPGTERVLFHRIIPKLKIETAEKLPRLSIWLSDWNDVLVALSAEGLGVSGAPLVESAAP